MAGRTNDALSILMIECGARWSWTELDHAGEDCLILAQQSDETPRAFADRVTRRIRTAVQSGRRLRRVVLAKGATSRDSVEARLRIQRLLGSLLDDVDDLAPDSRAA